MGLRYLLANQLDTLQKAGYEVVGVSAPGPFVAELEERGIKHYAVPFNRRPISPVGDVRAFLHLIGLLRRLRPTLVHTHNPKPTLYGQLAARLAGVPVVVNTLHGYVFTGSSRPWMRRFLVLCEKIAAPCADVILSQNSEDIETARLERICPPAKLRHLGNGIDLERFRPDRVSPAAQTRLRAELGLQGPGPVVGFVGRLVAEKGVPELLSACRSLLAEFPTLKILLVGPSDPDKPDSLTPAVAEGYGLSEQCIFTGLRNDMPDLYSVMDVLALPSHREGFPRSPMEASAMGVPTVVTDVRGCRDVVVDGLNGHLVPLKDPIRLGVTLAALLRSPDRRRELGERGRTLARERFDERRVFARVMAEYDRLLRPLGLAPTANPVHLA